jgi:hypothetical protein
MRNKFVPFLLLSATLFAQATKPLEPAAGASDLHELVNEVRLLRQALERSTLTNTRLQVLLQRTQLQSQRVNQATARLEGLRARIAQLLSEQSEAASAVRMLPDRIAAEQDHARKKEMENQFEATKMHLEQVTQMEASLRGHEADADTALRKEQTVWEELGSQLTLLEQSLAPIPRP